MTGHQDPESAGSAGVDRYYDPYNGLPAAKIHPGQYYVTDSEEVIVTVLGSCVSVCMRDEGAGLCGMNHFMLPDEKPGRQDPAPKGVVSDDYRYGAHAMETLINQLLKRGARRKALRTKVFGGGRVLPEVEDIGAKNVLFVRTYLDREGLRIDAQDVGGACARKIYYFQSSGRARVKRIKQLNNQTLPDRETAYRRRLAHETTDGFVELFNGSLHR